MVGAQTFEEAVGVEQLSQGRGASSKSVIFAFIAAVSFLSPKTGPTMTSPLGKTLLPAFSAFSLTF